MYVKYGFEPQHHIEGLATHAYNRSTRDVEEEDQKGRVIFSLISKFRAILGYLVFKTASMNFQM